MKVAVILTARASWAKLQTVCAALKARPDVELQIIACASALLERYGKVIDVVTHQGFDIAEEIYSVIEGETTETSGIETGVLASALSRCFRRLVPDAVLVVADRHEVLAAAQAAAYQHITLIHCQGGERTGSIDDKVRDSITALADIHLVCTERAKWRVYGLTGSSQIYQTGCPSIDLAKQALLEPPLTDSEIGGAGEAIDFRFPFLVLLQHPVTSEALESGAQMMATLHATRGYQTVALWPGQDAGSGAISKAIRTEGPMRVVKNLPPARFLKLLTQASCLVGNSSAGIREASYLGVPVVNIGSRQHGRERAANVVDVPHDARAIAEAISRQMQRRRYLSSTLYGHGNAGEQIAEVVCNRWLSSRPDLAPLVFPTRTSVH